MSRPIDKKCLRCALTYIKPSDIKYNCYDWSLCSRRRSYYRKLDENRTKQREYHKYIKFRGDHCVLCKNKENLEAHHILPQYHKGEDIKENIITLCNPCHNIITSYHRTIGYI